jgi:hypothetical protein
VRVTFNNSFIGKLWWKFKWKFIPSHQYNKLDTGLPLGYYDPDTQILYAVMRCFQQFMEEGAPNCSWGTEDLSAMYADPAHKAAHQRTNEETQQVKKELDEIYDWWVNRYLKSCDEFENLSASQLKKRWREMRDLEERLEQEADVMLAKLMKHRRCLWYP